MKDSVRKLISTALSITTALGISALGMGVAFAGQLTHNSVTLTNDLISQSSSYTFTYNNATAATIKQVTIQFSTTPSGSGSVPHNLSTASAAITTFTNGGTDVSSSWSVNGTSTPGTLIFTNSGGTAVTSGGQEIITVSGITNNDLTSHCDGITGNTTADTCYVRLTTYTDAGTSVSDQGVSTYTVVAGVSATATVDPILTFQVTGVAGATSAGSITTNDPYAADGSGPTTTAVDTTPTTIPFGNVGVGRAKVAQQQLGVQTNANNGYTVYAKFNGTQVGSSGSSYMMAGTQGTNKLDPFVNTGTAATWAAPQTFVSPTSTTTNTNSGWVGMRTNNIVVNSTSGTGANYSATNEFGPPAFGTGSIGNAVMTDSGPDNGTAKTSVTYKIAVDAYQPADLYTGTIVYSAVASY